MILLIVFDAIHRIPPMSFDFWPNRIESNSSGGAAKLSPCSAIG
jgi:hypothetical protein